MVGLQGGVPVGTQFLPPWGVYLTAPTVPLVGNGALVINKLITIFKNMTGRLNTASSGASTVSAELLKNGASTGLIVTMGSGVTFTSNTINAVTCYRNDVVTMQIIGTGGGSTGSDLAVTVESY
jgi:long-subunit acyl-CoA synthetase (AMP-forming)